MKIRWHILEAHNALKKKPWGFQLYKEALCSWKPSYVHKYQSNPLSFRCNVIITPLLIQGLIWENWAIININVALVVVIYCSRMFSWHLTFSWHKVYMPLQSLLFNEGETIGSYSVMVKLFSYVIDIQCIDVAHIPTTRY